MELRRSPPQLEWRGLRPGSNSLRRCTPPSRRLARRSCQSTPVSSRSPRFRSAPDCTLVVTTPFTGGLFAWQSIALLVAVILVAMFFIVVVVQIELRRPLRRLDSAVAALGTGDFDRPVHAASTDEVGRLGASFEAMRTPGSLDDAHHRHARKRRHGAEPCAAARDSACQCLRGAADLARSGHGDHRGERFRDERSVRRRRRGARHLVRRHPRPHRSAR